jgi:tetratricopeptide (TPR) repeat protein
MSCYLKSAKFEECVNEGSEILAYDSSNVKAYYRRGQAYKELGNLEAAVADLGKAHEISPEDETIAEVLRDAEEKLTTNLPKGLVIEEIVEEEEESFQPSSPQNVVTEKSDEIDQSTDQPSLDSLPSATDMQDVMRTFMEDPAMQQVLTSMMKNMSPDTMADMSRQFGLNLTTEDAAKAQDAISQLSPESLHKMMKWMDRAQRGVEAAKKTKNWLMARKGLIIAIVLLIVAFILHRLGFIGR